MSKNGPKNRIFWINVSFDKPHAPSTPLLYIILSKKCVKDFNGFLSLELISFGGHWGDPGDHKVTAYKNFSKIFVIGQSEYALHSLVRDQKHVSDSNGWLFSLISPNWQIWGSQEPKIWWKLVKNWIFSRENCKGWFCKVSYFTGWHAQTVCQCHKSGCYLFGQVQRVQKGWIWPKMLKSHFWGSKSIITAINMMVTCLTPHIITAGNQTFEYVKE